MKYFFSIILLLVFFSLDLSAQQWVQFSQQHNYNEYVNPAYTGFNSVLSATVAHRSQYVGLGTKAIGTQYVSFSSPAFTSKLGLGVRMINDFIGYQRYTNVDVTAAYHILEKKHKLSAGISVGMVQLSLDGSQLTAPDGSYTPGLVVHNDDFLPNVKAGGLAPTISFGAMYGYRGLLIGAAVQNINSPHIKLSESNSGTIINLSRTINIHASYVIEMNKARLKPSFFCKTDLNKLQAQVNMLVDWKKITAGLGFRGYSGLNNDALIALFGFKIKDRISVNYSYDYNLSFLNNSNSGSHEISLKFELPRSFKQIVKSNIIFNPRYL